jgi:F-type H+-transporting ATPase subunit b
MAEFIAELVGFVVILFVLWKYVLPPVGGMVRKRQDEVQRQVDEAEEATRKLEDARARLDDAVQRAEAEGARIRDDARAEATRIREELKEQAEAEVERMLQRGREQLVADRDHAVRRLRTELGGASMELAERVIRTTLDDDGARVDTVESFLSEIESLPSPRGSVRATTGGGA